MLKFKTRNSYLCFLVEKYLSIICPNFQEPVCVEFRLISSHSNVYLNFFCWRKIQNVWNCTSFFECSGNQPSIVSSMNCFSQKDILIHLFNFNYLPQMLGQIKTIYSDESFKNDLESIKSTAEVNVLFTY